MGIIKYLFGKKKSVDLEESSNSLAENVHSPNSDNEISKQSKDQSTSLIHATNSYLEQGQKAATNGFWSTLFQIGDINEDFFEQLEESLIQADLGAKTAFETVKNFRQLIKKQKIKKVQVAIDELKKILINLLPSSQLKFKVGLVPVLCLVGVNGTGKTTTLSKLAHHFQNDYKVVVAAADTFRAAATLQLEEWTKKLNVQFISKGSNSDAAAVAYDAVEATLAKSDQKGLCLIDTAGRLENKVNLMEQLNKLIRILERFKDRSDLKKILVLDATLGRNGIDQARVFYEKIKLDGIIITKVDTQAKAGFLLTISQELQLPIFYITYGEQLNQLAPFERDEYVDTLLTNLS